MKIAALTMVYRDHWALSQWYAHHAAALGADALYVIAHGADPEIARLCPGASIITVPRDRFAGFDRSRGALMDGIAAGLLNSYDWVIRSDADELLCWDPARHASLRAAIEAHAEAPVLWALGLDLVEDTAASSDVWHVRRAAAFSGHYTKAIATRRAIAFQLHGVRVAPRRVAAFPFVLPRGLYLVHLKFANSAALAEANAVRMDVATRDEPGLPGAGWRDADADATAFVARFAAKTQVQWATAEAEAYEALAATPRRDTERNIVKARALKFDTRTYLPDWVSTLG